MKNNTPDEAAKSTPHRGSRGSLRRDASRRPDHKPRPLSTMGRIAMEYATHGFAVFPLHMADNGECSCGNGSCSAKGKHPLYKKSFFEHGAEDASTGTERVRAFWREWPEANIGIHCERSGIVVIDVDPRNGGDETLRDLVEKHGADFLETAAADTGGGGNHFVYEDPGIPLKATLGRGIDVKRNGYIVAAPSMHASGSEYAWQIGRDPVSSPPAPMPEWMIEALRSDYVPEDYEPQPYDGPEAALEPIVEGCGWIAHCRDDAFDLAEPEWYRVLSILGRVENGRDIAHEWSSSYPGYTAEETDRKLDHALEAAGPVTCAYIEDKLGYEGCAACPVRGKVKSPIVLGRPARPPIMISGRTIPDLSADVWDAILASPELGQVVRTGNQLLLIEVNDSD